MPVLYRNGCEDRAVFLARLIPAHFSLSRYIIVVCKLLDLGHVGLGHAELGTDQTEDILDSRHEIIKRANRLHLQIKKRIEFSNNGIKLLCVSGRSFKTLPAAFFHAVPKSLTWLLSSDHSSHPYLLLSACMHVSVCLSVCLSVTCWYCIETAVKIELFLARLIPHFSLSRYIIVYC